MTKCGLVSVSFRDRSPKEILQYMQKAGLSYIEWGSDVHAPKDDKENLYKIKKLTDSHGITCCSYGTYFRIGQDAPETVQDYIDAAKILGCDILRLWCGKKGYAMFRDEEKEMLFADCRKIAKIAEENGVKVCMECHPNTFTDVEKGALELMDAVQSENFGMYWQPNQFTTVENNLHYAESISKYTSVLHVFNWKEKEKYPLADAAAIWRKYMAKFSGNEYCLLEFMPDGKIESLQREAAALFEIVKPQ